MTRFCGNCGAPVPDGARVCGQCGAPVEDAGGFGGLSSETKDKVKTYAIFGAAGVALIVVMVVAATILSNFIGYKNVVRKAMNAYRNGEPEILADMASEVFDYYRYTDAEDYFDAILNSDLDYFETKTGYDYKISYKITESKMFKEKDRKYKSEMEDLSGYVDDPEDFISRLRIVELEITAKGKKKSTTVTRTLYLTMEDKAWRILRVEFD